MGLFYLLQHVADLAQDVAKMIHICVTGQYIRQKLSFHIHLAISQTFFDDSFSFFRQFRN